jgi:hypothetical protein
VPNEPARCRARFALPNLLRHLQIYNHHIPQRAVKHQTPIQALKEWQSEKPELFVKRVYKQAGLDT